MPSLILKEIELEPAKDSKVWPPEPLWGDTNAPAAQSQRRFNRKVAGRWFVRLNFLFMLWLDINNYKLYHDLFYDFDTKLTLFITPINFLFAVRSFRMEGLSKWR